MLLTMTNNEKGGGALGFRGMEAPRRQCAVRQWRRGTAFHKADHDDCPQNSGGAFRPRSFSRSWLCRKRAGVILPRLRQLTTRWGVAPRISAALDGPPNLSINSPMVSTTISGIRQFVHQRFRNRKR